MTLNIIPRAEDKSSLPSPQKVLFLTSVSSVDFLPAVWRSGVGVCQFQSSPSSLSLSLSPSLSLFLQAPFSTSEMPVLSFQTNSS